MVLIVGVQNPKPGGRDRGRTPYVGDSSRCALQESGALRGGLLSVRAAHPLKTAAHREEIILE